MTPSLMLVDDSDLELSDQKILGRGTLGPLYRGRQRSTGRSVAIRLLTPAVAAAAPALADRLRRYASQLSPLDSSGAVPLLGSGFWGEKLFYAMELIAGESLADCTAQAHRFTTDEIIQVAEGIVEGLNAAWKNGLVPSGIKPSAVFLTAGGAVRIAELGLAGAIAESTGVSIVRVQGRYVAPELVYGDPPDIRSELYSLGVMLYELSTRTLPFEGYDSTTSFHYQLLHVEPVAPRELGSFIPRELERVVMRCLAKAPSDRYQTPQELLEDLEAVRRQQGSSPALPGLPPDEPGDFDIYEDQVIGEGGMGILYRARQHSLGRPVAVKVIRDAFTASPEFVQRFRHEAELLAQVNHPNVVQVFGTGTWHGRLFYAMELVEGKDVASRLREIHRFGSLEVLHIAEGVARALGAAWKFRIVHRDIKPSNILLTADGSVKVADFGLAKSLRIRKSDSRLIAGTAEYISPEQGMGMPVDVRSDIYSLGVVLFELLMGKPPFKSDGSFTFVVYQHVHSSPPALGNLQGAPEIPAAVRGIIEKCLEKKPERRYQRPEDLLAAIEKARESMSVSADAPPRTPAGRPPAAPSTRRERLRAKARELAPKVALFGLMLVGALIVVLAVGRRSPAAAPPPPDLALLLGLGDYDAALELARRQEGPNGPEARTVIAREKEARRSEWERLAQEAIHRQDWDAADRALENAEDGAGPSRKRELESAREYCREFLRARTLVKEGRVPEAIALYRRAGERVPFLKAYCSEQADRLGESAPGVSRPHH
ncbi:MAG TPA: serine/threonine-protein kinase [Planctomycetota bacterium]|nr:serine/threonine-protein kinase [Planctomycetota bacterium]